MPDSLKAIEMHCSPRFPPTCPIQSFPPALEKLTLSSSQLGLPPFPSSLRQLHFINSIPDCAQIPPSVRTLKMSGGRLFVDKLPPTIQCIEIQAGSGEFPVEFYVTRWPKWLETLKLDDCDYSKPLPQFRKAMKSLIVRKQSLTFRVPPHMMKAGEQSFEQDDQPCMREIYAPKLK